MGAVRRAAGISVTAGGPPILPQVPQGRSEHRGVKLRLSRVYVTRLYVARRERGARNCDKATCRANQQKPVESLAQKYSAFVLPQISGITPRVSRRMRGARERHERAVGCDGRSWRRRRTRLKRTAKSCGSDVAVLASRSGEAKLLWDNGGKRAVLRGEHEVSRKAIAQGRPECSRCPVCSCALFVCAKSHARPRVQQAPGLPCAL